MVNISTMLVCQINCNTKLGTHLVLEIFKVERIPACSFCQQTVSYLIILLIIMVVCNEVEALRHASGESPAYPLYVSFEI